MSLPLHSEAEAEANRATEWYADRNPNVAVRFNEALTAAIDAIAADPKRYPVAEDAPEGWEVRNYSLVPDFPYRLVYLVAESRIVVVAVAHTSRAPGYWSERIPSN